MIKLNVAVLGGFGFIGRHLTDHLLKCGYNVTIFGRKNKNIYYPSSNLIRYVYGDFSDATKVKEAISDSDVVFHLLGNSTPASSIRTPQKDIEENLLPTLALFEYCQQAAVKQIIFASSGGTVYGIPNYLPIDEDHPTLPICAYGINKLTTEHYMRLYSKLHGINMTAIRLANPYGPFQNIKRGQGIIGTFCEHIASSQPLQIWGDGCVVRDYIYIDDVATALEKVIGKTQGYQFYNLGSGIGTNINELVSILSQATSQDIKINYLTGRDIDVPINILNIKKFRTDFNWEPKFSLEEGIKLTLKWHQNKS
jgi:UDP-glucose 4-epimerase